VAEREEGPENVTDGLCGQFLHPRCQTVTGFLPGKNSVTGGLSRLNGRAPAVRESQPGSLGFPIHHHVTGPQEEVRAPR